MVVGRGWGKGLKVGGFNNPREKNDHNTAGEYFSTVFFCRFLFFMFKTSSERRRGGGEGEREEGTEFSRGKKKRRSGA